MIQFFRFNTEDVEDSEFRIITGRDASLFFLKSIGIFILFIYSTLFLAVAIPFVSTPFYPIYFLGALATSFYFIRIFNYIIMYIRYSGSKLRITGGGIDIITGEGSQEIPAENITYIEYNLLGNLVIKQKYDKVSFPVNIMKEKDREKLLMMFQDMAPKRTRFYMKIWEIIDAVAVALVLAVHIIQYIIQAYYIPTESMEDTLKKGDHIFVEKITYGPIIPKMIGMEKAIHLDCLGIRDINRKDIVIFRPPHEIDKDYIKRCIALPGDKFDIRNNSVYINGKKLDEPYTNGITTYYGFGRDKNRTIEGIVPDGHIIVLGDNRENSQDSRYFGYLDMKRVKGKAFILYWNTQQILNLDFSRLGLIR